VATITRKLDRDIREGIRLYQAGTPLFSVDTETTGLVPETDRLLKVSVLKCRFSSGLFIEEGRMVFKINAGQYISEPASKINGITNAMIKSWPTEANAYKSIKAYLGTNPFICGYNSKAFDIPFLKSLYARYGEESFDPVHCLDIKEMAKELLYFDYDCTFDKICKKFGADEGIRYHKGADNTIANIRCLRMLLREYAAAEVADKHIITVKSLSFGAGKIPQQDRLYASTEPYTKTYYDIRRKKWVSEDPLADLERLQESALHLLHVTDMETLVEHCRRKGENGERH